MEGAIISKLWPLLTALFLFVGVIAAYANDDRIRSAEELETQSRAPIQNLLINPSFEGQYNPYIPPGGHPDCPAGICLTAQMAGGWTPYWRSHNPADPGHIYLMPEYKPAELNIPPPPRVRTGERAQQYFTFWKTHMAGIYQRVQVEPGRLYCFSIWGHSWSSDDDNPQTSDSPSIQKIGIDPFGGVDWQSPNILWGSPTEQYNEYALFLLCSVAQSEYLTVYTFSEPIWAVKHNDVYWDDAELVLYDHVLEVPQQEGVTFLADVDDPRSMSRVITVNIPEDDWVTWHAELVAGGTVAPTLNRSSGNSGDELILTVNSTGKAVGIYTAELTITTTPALPGSPATVPIKLVVVPEIYFNNLANILGS